MTRICVWCTMGVQGGAGLVDSHSEADYLEVPKSRRCRVNKLHRGKRMMIRASNARIYNPTCAIRPDHAEPGMNHASIDSEVRRRIKPPRLMSY